MRMFAAVLLLSAGMMAKADTIYTTMSAWDAAVPGETTVDFAGIATPTEIVFYGTGVGTATTLGGITYTAVSPTNADDYLGVIGSNYPGVDFGVPTLAVGGEPPGPAALLITLPAAVNALGFVFDNDDSPNVTITLSDGTAFTESSMYPVLDFFGVTSSTNITSVEISDSLYPSAEQAIFLSQVAFGPSVSGTPEPGTGALLAAALLGLGVMFRKKAAFSLEQPNAGAAIRRKAL